MKITIAALAACLLASAASAKGPEPKYGSHPAPAASSSDKDWASAQKDIDAAVRNYQSAGASCQSATREYDDLQFAGGIHNQAEINSRRSAKERACTAVVGAETKILDALDKADKFLTADIAARTKAKQSITDDESRKKYVAKLRSEHSMGHSVNLKKH